MNDVDAMNERSTALASARARSWIYKMPKLNTNDINISMRARIQIVPEL